MTQPRLRPVRSSIHPGLDNDQLPRGSAAYSALAPPRAPPQARWCCTTSGNANERTGSVRTPLHA